jgi:sulfite reductase (NADPH) flavoprotein alpha-component
MREHGAELWRRLQEGAHLCVCGDAGRMARDVDGTLRDVAATHGGLDLYAYVKRYLRDVY